MVREVLKINARAVRSKRRCDPCTTHYRVVGVSEKTHMSSLSVPSYGTVKSVSENEPSSARPAFGEGFFQVNLVSHGILCLGMR